MKVGLKLRQGGAKTACRWGWGADFCIKWVAAAKTDLGDPTPVLEQKYLAGLQRGLGTSYVNETLKPYTPSGSSVISSHSEPQPLSHPTKPWGRG